MSKKIKVEKFYVKGLNDRYDKGSMTSKTEYMTVDEFKEMFKKVSDSDSNLVYVTMEFGATEMFVNVENLNILFFTKKVNDNVDDGLMEMVEVYKFIREYVDKKICKKYDTVWVHEYTNCTYGITEGNVFNEEDLRVVFSRDVCHNDVVYCVMGTKFSEQSEQTVFNPIEISLQMKYGLHNFYGLQYAIDIRETREFDTQMLITTWLDDEVLDKALRCFEQLTTNTQFGDDFDGDVYVQ